MTLLRAANLSDAKQLAELAEATFRDTFAEFNTPEDLLTYCQSSYGEAIQAAEIANPDYETVVAESGDRLVAYAQLRWGQAPKCVPGAHPGEIQRLYVENAFHGKGLAQQLMALSLQLLQARSSEYAWLGVWENNPRAIAFYRKFDFEEVGAHIFQVGSDPQRDIILARPLSKLGSGGALSK